MAGFYNFRLKAGDTARYYIRNTDGRFNFTGWVARMQFRHSYKGDLVLELNEGNGLTTHNDGGGTAELEVTNGTDNYTLIEGAWHVRPDGVAL
jgi:hypothetical protein